MVLCVEIEGSRGRAPLSMTKKGREIFGIGFDDQQGDSYSLSNAPGQEGLRVIRFTGNSEHRAHVARTGIRLGSVLRMRRVGLCCMVRVIGKHGLLCLSRNLCEKIIVQPVKLPRIF